MLQRLLCFFYCQRSLLGSFLHYLWTRWVDDARPVPLFRHIRFLCSWWNIKWIISFSRFICSFMSGVVVECQSVHHWVRLKYHSYYLDWQEHLCRQLWFCSGDSHWLITCWMTLKEIRCLVVLFSSVSRWVWHQQWCSAVWTEVVKRKLRLKALIHVDLLCLWSPLVCW